MKPGSNAPVSLADSLNSQMASQELNTISNFPAGLPELQSLTENAALNCDGAFEALVPEQERRKNRKGNPYWQSFTSGKHGEIGRNILARLKFTLSLTMNWRREIEVLTPLFKSGGLPGYAPELTVASIRGAGGIVLARSQRHFGRGKGSLLAA